MPTIPRLLITRLAPHAQHLANQLNHAGIFSISQPLLEVVALPEQATLARFLSGYYDMVVAVSGNAVKYTQRQINSNWPDAYYFAIGESTQASLEKVSKQKVIMPSINFDSEGVLALDELKDVENKKILILRGEGGRNLLHETLHERGAEISFLETYKRIAVELDGRKCVNEWQQAQINGAIISSVEILNQLVKLVPSHHKCWLLALNLYVPSQRVAEHANRLGFKSANLLPSLRAEQIVKLFTSMSGSV